jgi:hypothetical protein
LLRRQLFEGVAAEQYAAAERDVAEITARLRDADMTRPDAPTIIEEFHLAADLLTHACRRGRHLLDPAAGDPRTLTSELNALVARHRQSWATRNRKGGLPDSAARLERAPADYERPRVDTANH